MAPMLSPIINADLLSASTVHARSVASCPRAIHQSYAPELMLKLELNFVVRAQGLALSGLNLGL